MTQCYPNLLRAPVFAAVLLSTAIRAGFAMAQTANSNAGLEGGQDNLFDAILATPQQKTPVLPDNVFATAPGLEQPARARNSRSMLWRRRCSTPTPSF